MKNHLNFDKLCNHLNIEHPTFKTNHLVNSLFCNNSLASMAEQMHSNFGTTELSKPLFTNNSLASLVEQINSNFDTDRLSKPLFANNSLASMFEQMHSNFGTAGLSKSLFGKYDSPFISNNLQRPVRKKTRRRAKKTAIDLCRKYKQKKLKSFYHKLASLPIAKLDKKNVEILIHLSYFFKDEILPEKLKWLANFIYLSLVFRILYLCNNTDSCNEEKHIQ